MANIGNIEVEIKLNTNNFENTLKELEYKIKIWNEIEGLRVAMKEVLSVCKCRPSDLEDIKLDALKKVQDFIGEGEDVPWLM